ncbi:MAG TPA: hypothetical protein PK886_02845 [Candidatus Paceibacterota bacterium]|nr:hypothetical protein [Candidatus Paceibacterota bacterium]
MNDLERQFKLFASKIKLSNNEQEEIKANLLRQVFARSSMHTQRPTVSPFSMWLKFVPTALITILFVGGGVSFAAKDTLPGDLLYPFKLGVTEKVQGLLLVSTKEQAKFEIILVERRTEEAIKLVHTGKLDDKKNATLTEAIEKHTESINSKVEELKTTDKTAAKDVAGSLAASLTEQVENISKAGETQSVDATDVLPLAVSMQAKAKFATEEKVTIETEILLDPKSPALTEEDEESIDDAMLDIDLNDESIFDDLEDPTSLDVKNEILKTETVKGATIENTEIKTEQSVNLLEINQELEF